MIPGYAGRSLLGVSSDNCSAQKSVAAQCPKRAELFAQNRVSVIEDSPLALVSMF